ncbi:DHH family phosphoesterase [Vibrio sp.]|uniref:DHH family phosphoesterase n=1 Tax=Vibrio sp. TaxID=678 RepID=UPI003D0D556D
MHYDVFNGDADGIIALLQLRLAQPRQAQLVTGVKRDIHLLAKVDWQPGDSATVLDISMAKNHQPLEQALARGVEVMYVDHHQSGEVPHHPSLTAHIDLAANTCTSLIVDQLLDGEFRLWAIVAAYGDNLIDRADQLAVEAGLDHGQAGALKQLGTLINYNGYGEQISDLHYPPDELFRQLLAYPNPLTLIADHDSPYSRLQRAYQQDMASVQQLDAAYQSASLQLFILPDQPSSRRVSGVFGNWLANQFPHQAQAVLTVNADGGYLVSLRAPLNNKQGAGDVCSQFATGGGREAAAGINHLAATDLQQFIAAVERRYGDQEQ